VTPNPSVVEIGPRPSLAGYLAEVWRARGIALFLAWRDVIVRFKQTLIGVVWVVMRPLLVALVFAFVFGRIAGLSSAGVPYVLFVMVAMLPWQFISAGIAQGAESLITNSGLISKIYFPRILLPISNLLSNFLDLLITLPIIAVLMIWYGIAPSQSALIMVPFWLLIMVAMTFGLAAILSALNALYRDVRYLVPFILLFALYISPIGYGIENVPVEWQPLYCLNPLAALFDALRAELLGTPRAAPAWASYWTVVVAFGLALCSVVLFWRAERRIVDVI